jgi:hypothetical protein
LVQTDEERKAKDREHHATPEYKERAKLLRKNPERKAKAKEWRNRPENRAKARAQQLTPKSKADRKKRQQTPEYKAKAKEYELKPERIKKKAEQHKSPEYKAQKKEYRAKPETKVKIQTRRLMPENIAKRVERQQSPEHRAKKAVAVAETRWKVLQYYSKTLSNSNIPCCRCCGLDEHMDFLAIDHIGGRNQMNYEPELVKLGYSSKLLGSVLYNWIRDNKFPDGFQVLCNNCNYAKGMKKNKNKCPHETMEWNGQFDGTTAKRV